MRKVWFREGSISRSGDVRPRENRSVTQAEARLRENADSRDRHRDLVRALSRAGQLQRAEEVAKQWLERDPLDPEALTYLSDVVGRRGDRGRALRLLSGIVDLEPENEQLQERLADAMARGDRRQHACAHRVALAEIKRDGDEARARNDRGRARSRRSRAPEANATVDAIRCSRALGQSKVVEALLNSVPHEQRALVEGQSYDAPSEPRRGERVSLNARWFTGDLDLSIITPQGTRLSWMGGRRSVSGESAMSPSLEELTLRTASPGTYYIEVNRPTAGSGAARGEIRASVYGTSSTIPFEFTGERAIVGRFTVARRWRLQ